MKNIWNGLKPAMLMVLVQITFSALNVIYKLAISDGMSMRVATAYRLIFASAFTIPLALIFDRFAIPTTSFLHLNIRKKKNI